MDAETTALDEVCAAFEKTVTEVSAAISPYVVHTPIIRLPWLDTAHQEFWAKLECWQLSGSIKIRPAFHAVASLAPDQPLVTVSDGNHALAVATASSHLRHACTVVVPANASAVRVRRLVELGADVEVAGSTIDEATDYARTFAARQDTLLVEPFTDLMSAACLATSVDEAFSDEGLFDNVIAPLGSGTLFAGVGALATALRPFTRLIATCPMTSKRAPRISPLSGGLSSRAESALFSVGSCHQISGPVAWLLEHLPVNLCKVDEVTVSQGIVALLHRQNLLVDGAGAAAVGAILNDRAHVPAGRTLILLTGANIGSTELARAFAVEIPQPDIRRQLGLRGRTTAFNAAAQPGPTQRRWPRPQHQPKAGPTIDLRSDARSPWPDLDAAASLLRAHRDFADEAGLPLSAPAHNALDEVFAVARHLQGQLESGPAPVDENGLRLLLRLNGFISQSMEWASAAQDQSGRINFFNPTVQSPNFANYARYGDPSLRSLELNLAEMLGFVADDIEILMTSSGMAAYQLIESYLLRHVLRPGDTVVCAPYIYFEAREQLTALTFLNHVQANSYQVCDLIEAVETNGAKVLFVDPVANVAGLPTVDLRELANAVVGNQAWTDRWIIIDGTMISGGIDIQALFPAARFPQIMYYESASKHAQMGLDLTMAGICVFPTTIAAAMRTQRRNTGSILYPDAVARFPRTTRRNFLSRMQRISGNATLFASTLRSVTATSGETTVAAVDNWADLDWLHGGSVATLSFRRNGMNNRDVLESLVERLILTARAKHIPLVRGVSFGLSTSRVSTASSTAEFHDPFVRFSLGTEAPSGIHQLGLLTAGAVAEHLDLYGERRDRDR